MHSHEIQFKSGTVNHLLNEDMEFTTQSTREALHRLVAQRDALEVEADAIYAELTSPGLNGEPPAGVKTPLIDAEGYPRGDIDIINVKNKRRRLAEINTDHKALMKQIEQALARYHETLPAYTPPTASEIAEQSDLHSVAGPMAKLDQVLEGSPAAEAGIRENDLLLQFGDITAATEAYLNSIVQLVGRSVNQPVAIVVQRATVGGGVGASERLELTIVPKPWGGRGLLGCHLTPIQQ